MNAKTRALVASDDQLTLKGPLGKIRRRIRMYIRVCMYIRYVMGGSVLRHSPS